LLKNSITNLLVIAPTALNRKSNEIERAALSVDEVADLTINFTAEIILKVYFQFGYFKMPIIHGTVGSCCKSCD
jgi:predicted DNA-binding helix-hairpin-helix protein